MVVYYKFKSAKDYNSIPTDGPSISVATLKQKIFESMHLNRGTDFDLVVTNAQTNEEYLDEAMLIPIDTSVLIRRVPVQPHLPIVIEQEIKVENNMVETEPEKSGIPNVDASSMKYPDDSEWNEFGNEIYAIPDESPVQLSNLIPVSPHTISKTEEDSRIKAFIDTPAFDWQLQGSDGYGRDFGRGMDRRMAGGRGFGLQQKTPPSGYVCHRCKVPGHFIQHCPTNSDPNYDFKRGTGILRSMLMEAADGSYALQTGDVAFLRPNKAAFEEEIEGLPTRHGFGLQQKTTPPGYVCDRCKVPGHFIQHCPTNGNPSYDHYQKRLKPPRGIPRSMLMAAANGSYALPNGDIVVLKPNEAAFEKEIEGLPTTHSISDSDIPPELRCPMCKDVMKDAALTSKCCFKTFCDKCIRDYIISKSVCVCGAANILADDLLPNLNTRDLVSRMMETGTTSAENAGSAFKVKDLESVCCPQPEILYPTSSAVSKGEHNSSPSEVWKTKVQGAAKDRKALSVPPKMSEEVKATRAADVSEATHESVTVKEPASQGSVQLIEEEVLQKLTHTEADFQWKTPQDFGADYYMMPMAVAPPPGYNPYWNGMQPGMEGFVGPYAGAMQMMNYGLGPLDMPFRGVIPHNPFGIQNYMMPVAPPPRDLAELSMGMNMDMNASPTIMSREQFEAWKADLRRKREIERRGERGIGKDWEMGREVNGGEDVPPMKAKFRTSSAAHTQHHRARLDRPSPDRSSRDIEPSRSSKRKSKHLDRDYDNEPLVSSKRKSEHKASVFSRISFPEGEVSKKKKIAATSSSGESAFL